MYEGAETSNVVAADFARRLERERDEANAKLSTVHRWIERNHPDGFIDSQTYLQNLERIADTYHDELAPEKVTRNMLIKKGAQVQSENAAMREAIREAITAINRLMAATTAGSIRFGIATLFKLHFFITNVSQPSEEHNKA